MRRLLSPYCILLPLLIGCSRDNPPSPAPVAQGQDKRFEGTLDVVDEKGVRGWAWDKTQPDTPIRVDVFDGTKLLDTVLADKFRKGLAEKGKGKGNHGFSYPIPAAIKDGKQHSIRVKISGTDVELNLSPKTVTLSAK